MAEGQGTWKQACTERWDAFLVDKDMSPSPDTPLVWRNAFRYVKLSWGPEQQHTIHGLTRCWSCNTLLAPYVRQQHVICSDSYDLVLEQPERIRLGLPMYPGSEAALNDFVGRESACQRALRAPATLRGGRNSAQDRTTPRPPMPAQLASPLTCEGPLSSQ